MNRDDNISSYYHNSQKFNNLESYILEKGNCYHWTLK